MLVSSSPTVGLARCAFKLTETTPTGRRRTRVLRWKMSKAQAMDWSATNYGKILELVPRSGELPQPIEVRPSGGIMRTPGFGD